jgi:hypothetical protein
MAREGNSAVMTGEWLDPVASTPAAARTAPRVKGHRAFCPLRCCIRRHGAAASFREEHVIAADLLRLWADGATIGFSVERSNLPVSSIQYMPMTGTTRNARRQLQCRTDLTRVLSTFSDRQRALVVWVVLMNRSVSSWCNESQEDRNRVMPELVTALDQLVGFLDSEVREAIDHGAMV